MEIDLIIARFLHIAAGIIWVGAGFTATLILYPLATKMGERGRDFVRAWFTQSIFGKVMPVVSITTTLAGLYLYARLIRDGGLVGGLSQTGSIVLAIGALAGLLAFGHGIGIGRKTGQYAALVGQYSQGGNTQLLAQLTEMEAWMGRHGNISLILMVIAVVGMATARYF